MSQASNTTALLAAAKDAAVERCHGYVSPIMALFRSRRIPELADSVELHLNVLAFSLDATLGIEQDQQLVVEHAHDAIIASGVIDRYIDYLVFLVTCDSPALAGTAGGTGGFILNRLQNSADRSLNFCRALAKRQKFFRDFLEPFLTGRRQQQPTAAELPAARSLVRQAISVCINLLFKNDSEIYAELVQYRLHACAEPYLKCPDTTVSTTALILIAFVVDENQSSIFLGARENIGYLVNALRQGLASPERRSDGFDVLESAKCINRLALNDVNKELLVELEVLPIVKQMLASSNDSDVRQGLEILFALSFSKKNIGRIDAEFANVLKRLQTKELWRDNKVLQSLQFHLNEDAALKEKEKMFSAFAQDVNSPKDGRGQVMISYNHGSKPTVQRLYKRLVENNLSVWVDFKDLTNGSTLDAMSSAVENSSVVLLCVTRLYKESNNCRLEAEYAWKCGKKLIPLLMEPKYKATGWLGMIMGTQLYYDLSEAKYPFEQKFTEMLPVLLESLADRQGGSGTRGEGGSTAGSSTPQPPPSLGSGSGTGVLPPIAPGRQLPGLRDWDSGRVQAWCRERRLPSQVAALGLTGHELHFLAGAMHRSPEYFGRLMDRYFSFDRLQDVASLVNAIEDLTVGR